MTGLEPHAPPSSKPGSPLDGLGTALWLALAILMVSLARLFMDLPYSAGRSSEIDLFAELAASPALQWGVVRYALAVLLVYLALGFIGWVVGRVTAGALGQDARRSTRRWSVTAVLAVYAVAHLTNAVRVPNSVFSTHVPETIRGDLVAGMDLASVAVAGALLLWISLVFLGFSRLGGRGRPLNPMLAWGCGGLALLLASVVPRLDAITPSSARADALGLPNVIIIGVDSLRPDATLLGSEPSRTPNLDSFIADAHVFTDTTTPLARTFPSWISVLTGRHPVETNARANLTARERVQEGETLADRLRAEGYRTIIATDEVRFSNIDESYGFDVVIAPPAGITDFVLGSFSDLPIVNLLSNTRIAAWLFPESYANRAAFKTYDPQTFVNRLSAELDAVEPAFVAIHLTLPHYPYAWRDLSYDNNISSFRRQYPEAIRSVDRQFAEVLRVLRVKGFLENALLVVLSDHGEAVGDGHETMLPYDKQRESFWWNSIWGHGTSVLNPKQFQVLLAVRSSGNALVDAGPSRHGDPVSLEDVKPTLLELLGFPTSSPMDGVNLAALLRKGMGDAPNLDGRVRFTESEFNPVGLRATRVDEVQLAASARGMYEVRRDNGRIQLTESARQSIIRSKELLAMRGGQRLAALPAGSGGRIFLWFETPDSPPQDLGTASDVTANPDVAELLRALRERFPGEV